MPKRIFHIADTRADARETYVFACVKPSIALSPRSLAEGDDPVQQAICWFGGT